MSGQTTAVTLRVDKEFRDLIPPLSDGERKQLEVNLKADGCREPLVGWNGVIVDGHNRHAICEKHGIAYLVVEKDFLDRDAALLWIIDNQKGRRNIADIDRIGLASKRVEIVSRGKAKENLKTPTGGLTSAKLPKSQKPIDTRKESAKDAEVGERTYDAGKLILKAAADGIIPAETVEDIRRGRVAIHRVAKDIKEKKQREARQEKRIEAAKAAPELDARIIVGDFRKHADKIADVGGFG